MKFRNIFLVSIASILSTGSTYAFSHEGDSSGGVIGTIEDSNDFNRGGFRPPPPPDYVDTDRGGSYRPPNRPPHPGYGDPNYGGGGGNWDRDGRGHEDWDRYPGRPRPRIVFYCALSVSGFTFTGDGYSRQDAADDAMRSCINQARRVGRAGECWNGTLRCIVR